MKPTPVQIYTIGHSDHSMEEFIGLLAHRGIMRVVDVRSQPYSRWVPHFGRETLRSALEKDNIVYHFMGDALGGRPADPSLYAPPDAQGQDHSLPDYAKMATGQVFLTALTHLIELAEAESVVIMCGEGDHRRCHRALLITPALLEAGCRVTHITPEGTTVEAKIEPRQLTLL